VRLSWSESGIGRRADVLFESAARAFGPRAAGIVLSGRGNDGAVGLALIRAAGGIAIVQSPEEALCASMPRNALALVQPDACVPAAEIPSILWRAATGWSARCSTWTCAG